MDHAIARWRWDNFFCRGRRYRALSHRDHQLPRQSRLGRAHALGCAAADWRGAAVRDFRGHRRSCRGRSLDRSRRRSRRCGADAGGRALGDRCLRRRASCRATVPQARARPRRSGGAGAAPTAAERTRMSETETFITRWSRRKRQAAEEAEATRSSGAVDAAPECAHPNEDQREGDDAPRDGASDRPASAPDPTKLPPIETITAESDIRAFLAPGVPPELTRAALRRAWAADPKIRDFVGLADYDWDFNAPGAMTGFGSLEMTDELRQQIARMVGGNLANEATDSPAQTSAEVKGKPAPAETSTELVATAAEMSTQQVQSDAGTSQNERIGAQNVPHNSEALPQSSKVDIASRNSSENANNDQLIEKRLHGRALPK